MGKHKPLPAIVDAKASVEAAVSQALQKSPGKMAKGQKVAMFRRSRGQANKGNSRKSTKKVVTTKPTEKPTSPQLPAKVPPSRRRSAAENRAATAARGPGSLVLAQHDIVFRR